MNNENFIFNPSDAEQTERAEFFRFIHENDLRSEALAILDQARASTSKGLTAIMIAESGASLSQNLGTSVPKMPPVVMGANLVGKRERMTKFEATRKKLGMNQKSFASALGISQGMVSLIESGKAKASSEIMNKVNKLRAN